MLAGAGATDEAERSGLFRVNGLRRVRWGGLAHREGTYYDHGNPVLGCLIPDILNELLKDGLLKLGDPESATTRYG